MTQRTDEMHPSVATKQPRLRAATLQFGIAPEPDAESDSRTGDRIVEVVGPLKTTAMLLDDGAV